MSPTLAGGPPEQGKWEMMGRGWGKDMLVEGTGWEQGRTGAQLQQFESLHF